MVREQSFCNRSVGTVLGGARDALRLGMCLGALVCVFLSSCAVRGLFRGSAEDSAGDPASIVVASWNLQAFFDAKDVGHEYDEYRFSAGWSESKYLDRCDRLSSALAAMMAGGPDILAVQELENAATLEHLAAGPLKKFGYRWTAFACEDGASLGVGLLSRYPIAAMRTHSIVVDGNLIPRPILEAHLELGDDPLVVFVCHWKSKLGGAQETEGLRRASAAVLARRFSELAASQGSPAAIALGDFNENFDEFTRRGGAYPTALLPDTRAARESASSAQSGSALVLSAESPPSSRFFSDAVAVFSPWYSSPWSGSYAYSREWETIDHALLSAPLFDGSGWEYASFRVIDSDDFLNDGGFPRAYNPRTGVGLSDHLPIVVELTRSQTRVQH